MGEAPYPSTLVNTSQVDSAVRTAKAVGIEPLTNIENINSFL
jgi:hypothetical protein